MYLRMNTCSVSHSVFYQVLNAVSYGVFKRKHLTDTLFSYKIYPISGAHLGFSEGRGPKFRKGQTNIKRKKKRI